MSNSELLGILLNGNQKLNCENILNLKRFPFMPRQFYAFSISIYLCIVKQSLTYIVNSLITFLKSSGEFPIWRKYNCILLIVGLFTGYSFLSRNCFSLKFLLSRANRSSTFLYGIISIAFRVQYFLSLCLYVRIDVHRFPLQFINTTMYTWNRFKFNFLKANFKRNILSVS